MLSLTESLKGATLCCCDINFRNVFNLESETTDSNNDPKSEDAKASEQSDNNTNENAEIKATDFGMKLVKCGRLREYIYGIWEHNKVSEIEKEKDAVSAMMKHEEYQLLREQLAQLNMTVDDEGNILPIVQGIDSQLTNENTNNTGDNKDDNEDPETTMASA